MTAAPAKKRDYTNLLYVQPGCFQHATRTPNRLIMGDCHGIHILVFHPRRFRPKLTIVEDASA